MPVERRSLYGASALCSKAIAKRARGEPSQREDSAEQMEPVKPGQQIEERAVRIAAQVYPLPHQLPPTVELSDKKGRAQKRSDQEIALKDPIRSIAESFAGSLKS